MCVLQLCCPRCMKIVETSLGVAWTSLFEILLESDRSNFNIARQRYPRIRVSVTFQHYAVLRPCNAIRISLSSRVYALPQGYASPACAETKVGRGEILAA